MQDGIKRQNEYEDCKVKKEREEAEQEKAVKVYMNILVKILACTF